MSKLEVKLDRIPRKGSKMTGYEQYLFYKTIFDVIRQGNCGRREVAKALGMKTPAIWHPLRVLLDANAIKVSHYEPMPYGKREIFKVVEKI